MSAQSSALLIYKFRSFFFMKWQYSDIRVVDSRNRINIGLMIRPIARDDIINKIEHGTTTPTKN